MIDKSVEYLKNHPEALEVLLLGGYGLFCYGVGVLFGRDSVKMRMPKKMAMDFFVEDGIQFVKIAGVVYRMKQR